MLRIRHLPSSGVLLVVSGMVSLVSALFVFSQIFAVRGVGTNWNYVWPIPFCSVSGCTNSVASYPSWAMAFIWILTSVLIMVIGIMFYYRKRLRYPSGLR